jgi:hypothetical protein
VRIDRARTRRRPPDFAPSLRLRQAMSGRLSLDRVSLHLSRLTIQGPSLNPKPPASSAHSGRVRFQQIALGQHAAQIRSQTAFEDEDDDEYEDETEPA